VHANGTSRVLSTLGRAYTYAAHDQRRAILAVGAALPAAGKKVLLDAYSGTNGVAALQEGLLGPQKPTLANKRRAGSRLDVPLERWRALEMLGAPWVHPSVNENLHPWPQVCTPHMLP
jgi:hypothetical protein